ncbi:hypothetical protein FH972_022181 [Carpinus fangiana]|uniref:CAP-Gly domain-containing protein n=1 Tax=Carpinus fangiana TaxID=176857 RepID=A0A5N6KRV4_9ROSI|nr:hypothetical protein FH972_022181 [Carpinus fangiana]
MAASNFYEGKRLSYDGHLCTVRWTGEVAGTKGSWLGVEWDDPSRGKHSGEHNGVTYFKYTEGLGLKPASFEEQQVTYISGKKAEEVGFDKIRQQLANLKALRIVLVDSYCVSQPDAGKSFDDADLARDVAEACPRILDLNISRNLFEDWNEVLDIARQLKALHTLTADGLRLRRADSLFSQSVMKAAPFTRISSLSLSDTLLPWADVVSIAAQLPSLTSLSASGNEYRNLPSTQYSLPETLTIITLERNEFHSLADLAAALSTLPALQSLQVKSNNISEIALPDALSFSPTLFNVDLAYNTISTFTFIDLLPAVFPGLTSLRVSHNPIFSALHSTTTHKPLSADDGYILTLARLGKLKTLNFSVVTEKERLNAEAYYLSQVAAELATAGPEKKEEVLRGHRRYAELCEIYGDPTLVSDAPLKPDVDENSLSARLCKLSFTLDDSVAQHGAHKSSFDLEVPKSLTIYSTLGLVGRAIGYHHPMLLELVWESDELEVVRENEAEDDSGHYLPGSRASKEGAGSLGRSKFREEVLVPRTRQLGSWIEGRDARIRVQWSAKDVERQERSLPRP